MAFPKTILIQALSQAKKLEILFMSLTRRYVWSQHWSCPESLGVKFVNGQMVMRACIK